MDQAPEKNIELVITAADKAQRLDAFVAKNVSGVGRARAAALIEAGKITVNSRSVAKSYVLKEGDRICMSAVPEDRAVPDPQVRVEILLETDNFVIVNKPSGMPTHPISEGETGTLVNGLLAKYPEIAGVGYHAREPGVVHRLDTYTSGLILVARNQAAFEALHALLKKGEIEKEYIAHCHGKVKAPQSIHWSLYPDRRHPDRVKVWKKNEEPPFKLWPAETEIVESKIKGEDSRVKLSAHRAFRHQLRVHLAAIGHPIVGDTIYGDKDDKRPDGVRGHMLHASAISFFDPQSQKRIEIKAAPPW